MTDQPENDGFDEIVNLNTPSEGDEPSQLVFQTLTEAVQQVYPHLYDGILVRSLTILDRVNAQGERELRWVHSPDSQPWEVLGLLNQVLDDMRAENNALVAHAVHMAIEEADEDEEGEQ